MLARGLAIIAGLTHPPVTPYDSDIISLCVSQMSWLREALYDHDHCSVSHRSLVFARVSELRLLGESRAPIARPPLADPQEQSDRMENTPFITRLEDRREAPRRLPRHR